MPPVFLTVHFCCSCSFNSKRSVFFFVAGVKIFNFLQELLGIFLVFKITETFYSSLLCGLTRSRTIAFDYPDISFRNAAPLFYVFFFIADRLISNVANLQHNVNRKNKKTQKSSSLKGFSVFFTFNLLC